MTAAEKAMQDINALLEEHYSVRLGRTETLAAISRIVGAYEIERIGEQAS